MADLSVLIDLHQGGLLDVFFSGFPEILISDAQLQESSDCHGLNLDIYRNVFIPESYSATELTQALAMQASDDSVSFFDIIALILAARERAILLTGDGPLRKYATAQDIVCHGTLWVLDRLVESRHLSPERARAALDEIVRSGSRLPKAEVAKRLRDWL